MLKITAGCIMDELQICEVNNIDLNHFRLFWCFLTPNLNFKSCSMYRFGSHINTPATPWPWSSHLFWETSLCRNGGDCIDLVWNGLPEQSECQNVTDLAEPCVPKSPSFIPTSTLNRHCCTGGYRWFNTNIGFALEQLTGYWCNVSFVVGTFISQPIYNLIIPWWVRVKVITPTAIGWICTKLVELRQAVTKEKWTELVRKENCCDPLALMLKANVKL